MHCTACSQSYDGCGTAFDELFEADGGTGATNTMGDNCQESTIIFYIIHSIFSVPCYFFKFVAKLGQNFTSKGVTNGEDDVSNNAWSDLEMRGEVSWILHNIFLYIIKIITICLLSSFYEIAEFLVELIESEGSQLLLGGLRHLDAKVPFVTNRGV